MKILYIITKSGYGGAQTHISQCASFMKEKGNTVYVMAYPFGIGLEENLREKEIKFIPNIFLKNSFNPVNGIKAMYTIRKAVKSIQPDLISCHSSYAGFWGRLAVHNDVPTIFTAHGWGFTEGTGFLRAGVIKIAEKLVAPLCKKIICVSDNDKNLAVKYRIVKREKLVVIHNGVETNFPGNFEATDFLESGEGITPIIFVGRLDEPKKAEDLIRAFGSLPDSTRNKSFVYVIGDGPKRKMLNDIVSENRLEKKVKLLGSLSRKQIMKFLQTVIENYKKGIFVLISDYEGFPRSILEGMSFGFVVIASDVGGIREVVDNKVGILVKRRNIQQLKEALQFSLENPEKIKELGENAKLKIKENFSLAKMLSETEKVYQSVLEEIK